ncbi:MAG: S9 family peptidase [Balneolaceae bacterium]|nr:S9 family peptidase [Balneolaceae bacterium]
MRSISLKYTAQFIVTVCLTVLLPFDHLEAQKKETYKSLQDALTTAGQLSGSRGPDNVTWINGGDRYSYMEYNRKTQSLEIRAHTPPTGEEQLIFSNTNHTFPDSERRFQFRSYDWSEDSRYILFQTNFRPVYRKSGISDYYFYSIENRKLQLVVKDARTAELSPDGTKVGYERDGDLYVYHLDSERETRLTHSAREYVYNGRFGWVYEEEFGLPQAWTWSPDSKYIAFWHTDEREVPIFMTTDYASQHPEYIRIPYPKVGDTNPSVQIGVASVEDGSHRWMQLDIGDGYIPRLYWTAKEGTLAIVHLNRAQTGLRLYFHDVDTGQGRLVMEEQSDAWIDIFDFFAGVDHLFTFPEDREEFFWISDRDGWNHIYRYRYDGTLLNQVTSGKWEVTVLNAIDSENNRIYYTSTEVSPVERHLYSIDVNGKNKRRLSKPSGTHRISMGPNARYYLDRYSNISTPLQVELWEIGVKRLKKLEDNRSVRNFIRDHVYAPRELFRFTTSDGQKLDGYLIRPIDFDPNKSYPLIMNIYGGPGAQGVYNRFQTGGWTQYLAQQGYVIANVNNRGSGGYGRAFEKKVYRQLGKWEANDFVETAQHLAEKTWVDGTRMAIRGHSYGGYMACYTMLTHPNVFQVGIAGAPVTDWKLYDTIYTERYMGLLKNNQEGYNQSAAVTHADNLIGDLFVAHSAMDENVHMQNTMQLMSALARNGKDADLRIYPPGAHGVSFNSASYYLLYETYTEYLNRHLK